jgi:hypothetical protein
MKEWIRVFVFIPEDQMEEASKFGKKIDPDTGGAETFSVRLSVDGLEPPTAYGASTIARENTVEQIKRKLPDFPGAKLYEEREGWTWRKALKDAGLRQITAWE